MTFTFEDGDLGKIASVLNVKPQREERSEGMLVRYALNHQETGRRLRVEVLQGLPLPESIKERQPANLISAYAAQSFLQLQGCTGFIASKELGEVIFFARRNETVSGLVIEREAGCSLYANVDEYLLSSDFTKLPPEMVMSSVALSMTESLFNDLT